MRGLVVFNLWRWIEENRASFEPPVGNKVIWEDSQFTAMVVRGPNARRDFHVDPSDEIFYMLRGAMRLEYMEDGRRHERIIRELYLAGVCRTPSKKELEASLAHIAAKKDDVVALEDVAWAILNTNEFLFQH